VQFVPTRKVTNVRIVAKHDLVVALEALETGLTPSWKRYWRDVHHKTYRSHVKTGMPVLPVLACCKPLISKQESATQGPQDVDSRRSHARLCILIY
jgi:hypothetical protein